MKKELKQSLIAAIKEDTLCDWLYQHAYEMDHDEILILARELAYCIADANLNCCHSLPVLTDSINNLIEEVDYRIDVD